MEEIFVKIGYVEDDLCVSIPRNVIEEDYRMEISVTPMPGALEVNMVLTEPVYRDDDEGEDDEEYCANDDYEGNSGCPYHKGFFRM